MLISGFEKLTLLNYPSHVACIIFTAGCNFKCSYCQNSPFIDGCASFIDEKYILEYLKKRTGVLDGVVVSGGEPTVQNDLIEFLRKIKDLGYKIKLDTNGYKPSVLKKIIKEGLVDYIAMDIKHTLNSYDKVVGNVNLDKEKILKSIELIKQSGIDYEFRTTIIKGIHREASIRKIIDLIGIDSKYYIQNFESSENVIDKSLKSFSEEELFDIYNLLSKEYPNLKVRGLKNKLYEREEIKNV